MRAIWVTLLGAALACSGRSDPEAHAEPPARSAPPAPSAPPTQSAPPGKRDCSKETIRKLRGDADKAVGAKDYARAVALLEPFLRDCSDAGDAVTRGWIASDLAVAYERNDQPVECARLMAPLAHPKSAVQQAGNDKLIKAIQYNLDRCGKALDAKFAAIKPGGCSLTVDRAVATAAAPAALVPGGAAAACVALVRGPKPAKSADDDPDSKDVVCPRLALIWKSSKPALERRDVTPADAGALGDDSVCCNLTSLAAGTVGGKTMVRVRGHGRDCNGGTADTASDVFYEWNGSALGVLFDASLGFH